MNLVVDIGNTLIKYYIFSKKNVILFNKSNDLDNLIFGIKDYIKLIGAILISDVRGIDLSTITNNFDNKLIYKLKLDFKFPFKILYKSFDSIGEDRLGLMGSAYINFPKKDVLVIDIGSCITYDLLTKDGGKIHGDIIMKNLGFKQDANWLQDVLPHDHMYEPSFLGNRAWLMKAERPTPTKSEIKNFYYKEIVNLNSQLF